MNSFSEAERRKVTVNTLRRMKIDGRKIVMVTSYDYPSAAIADEVGVDSILVGDSYGMVVLGYDTTIPVTVDELLPICEAVGRGATHSLLIADMPFLSFQVSKEDAILNAGRFIKEGGMTAVKVEGGKQASHVVRAMSDAGIPVLGHIGVTPQTATLHGGYIVQGRSAKAGAELVEDAKTLVEAGVFGIVLEMVTEEVARIITETVPVPTIGIGSGKYCDGQVLVLHDILGLYPKFTPKFAKKYADVSQTIHTALQEYSNDVRTGSFPAEANAFRMDEGQRAKLKSLKNS